MKIYTMTTEKLISGSISDVEPFATKEEAEAAMRKDWEKSVAEYKATGKEPIKAECLIKDGYALLIRRSSTDRNAPIEKIEIWKIREAEFDAQAAVRAENGLVREVRSNSDIRVEVYDLSLPEFPEAGEENERDKREKEWEEVTRKPGWRQIW